MSVNTLRKENYGIPVGIKEKVIYNTHSAWRFRIGRPRRKKSGKETAFYIKEYQFVDDIETCKYKPGDLALTEVDKKNPSKRELVVVLDRYRVVKKKNVTYRDYMLVIMVLTGPKKGKVLKRQTVRGMELLKNGTKPLIEEFGDTLYLAHALNTDTIPDYFLDGFNSDLRQELIKVFKRHNVPLDELTEQGEGEDE